MSYLQLLQQEPVQAPQAVSKDALSRQTEERRITETLRVLNLCGVRIIRRGSELQVGSWEDLDTPELRRAIATAGFDEAQIVHLEGPGVPFQYKVRRCPDRKRGELFTAYLRRAEQEQLAKQGVSA